MGRGNRKNWKCFSRQRRLAAAEAHIDQFYNYGKNREGSVLFKPTLATEKQFRLTFEGALSYFVGGNPNFSKIMVSQLNHGLRLNGKVWELISSEIRCHGELLLYSCRDRDVKKVEYSFAYTKNDDGELKLFFTDHISLTLELNIAILNFVRRSPYIKLIKQMRLLQKGSFYSSNNDY